MFRYSPTLRCSFAMIICLAITHQARSQVGADINNGVVRLGVAQDGSLVINPISVPKNSATGELLLGVRLMSTNNDGSGAGTPVDGWGVGDTISNKYGSGVNPAALTPSANLTGITQSFTATTALCTATAAGIFQVTHDFHPSVHPNAYEITVTVKNISAATVNGRYRRTLDWDIEPTKFNEYLTIQGSTLTGILNFTNDGFSDQNPMIAPKGTQGDVLNSGPNDLGATITYDLGSIAPGQSVAFNHFYGAAPDRPTAMATIKSLGILGYTLASPSSSAAVVGTPNTFFYGFNASFLAIANPPAPKIPPATKLPDGDFAGSMGPTLPFSSGEGTFGNGGRGLKRGFGWSQSPMLATPTAAGPNGMRVLNVAYNHVVSAGGESSSNTGVALSIGAGLIFAAGLVLAAKKSTAVG